MKGFRTARALTAPTTPPGSSSLAVAGAWHEALGWLRVLHGAVLGDEVRRALGHRQRLVGSLQRLGRDDRATVEAGVDGWLSRNYKSLFAAANAGAPLPADATSVCGETDA